MQAGYFVMGSGKQEYEPPQALAAFLDKHPDAIYIGFGSLVVSNPEVRARASAHAAGSRSRGRHLQLQREASAAPETAGAG